MMRNITEIKYEIQEILNMSIAFKSINNSENLVDQLLRLIEREKNKSYGDGYALRTIEKEVLQKLINNQ
jgi:hypothetical protein